MERQKEFCLVKYRDKVVLAEFGIMSEHAQCPGDSINVPTEREAGLIF